MTEPDEVKTLRTAIDVLRGAYADEAAVLKTNVTRLEALVASQEREILNLRATVDRFKRLTTSQELEIEEWAQRVQPGANPIVLT